MSISHDTQIWHRRLKHENFELLNDLCKHELVIGLTKLEFTKNKPCNACQKGKQFKSSRKLKNVVSTSRPIELIHMDLFIPTIITILSEMHYAYVLVDDYSRYTQVCFLAHKNDAFKAFENFTKRIQKEKGFCISIIRSNHGTKFENEFFKIFYNENGISHTFSSPRTPQ